MIILHIAIINNLFKCVPKSYMSLSKPIAHHVISSNEHFFQCGLAALEILWVKTKIGIDHLTPLPIIPKWVITIDEKTPLRWGSSKNNLLLRNINPSIAWTTCLKVEAKICFKLGTISRLAVCKTSIRKRIVAIF